MLAGPASFVLLHRLLRLRLLLLLFPLLILCCTINRQQTLLLLLLLLLFVLLLQWVSRSIWSRILLLLLQVLWQHSSAAATLQPQPQAPQLHSKQRRQIP
jgi:ABC-type multidrug transport system fused ATPase/permease subunit